MSTAITAVNFVAAYVLPIYRNTRLYKKFTIKNQTTDVGIDLRGWTIFFTVKEIGSADTTDDDALIVVNHAIPVDDTDGANGIFYLDIPDDDTDIPAGKYDCDLMYISGGERYPLLKFKAKVIENITKREAV